MVTTAPGPHIFLGHRLPRARWLILAAGIVTLAAAGTTAAALTHLGPFATAGRPATQPAGGSHQHHLVSSTPGPAFAVVTTDPGPGAPPVASDTVLTVTFSRAPSPTGVLPTLDPPIAGAWAAEGDALVFHAAAPLVPGTAETLTVPGGSSGVSDSAGRTLAQGTSVHFTVASSTLRLQQLLAQLDYLPVSFTPTDVLPPAPDEMAQAQPGSFAWRWSSDLGGLESQWQPGTDGEITRAAVMTFEDQHHLTVDGLAGPRVWSLLLRDAAVGRTDSAPYDAVLVSKVLPENLTVWVNGAVQFPDVAVNTGVHGADTPDGTYAVYEHVVASNMSGTNPDGTHYNDPGVPWASYFYQGDALHGFVRASYGSPQSNGCVEMPIPTAGAIWPYTPIGTLVTVTGPSS